MALGQLLFDSLLHKEADGSLVPSLATGATVVDPQTIKVELRPGVKFQDKTPLDAEAVKATILRNRDANSVAFPAQIKNVSSVDVDSPTSLTIHLDSPVAGAFYPLLGGLATMPVSPTALAKNDPDPISNPLGAGPFMVKEYEPEQRMLLTKNPNYWNAKKIKLGGVEYVQAPTGPPAITALRGDAVDVIGTDVTQAKALNSGGLKTASGSSGTSLLWFNLCKSHKPLDDVRVRQALNYALDRDALNSAVVDGQGQVAWSMVPPNNSLYDPTLEKHYAYNVDEGQEAAEAGRLPRRHLAVADPVARHQPAVRAGRPAVLGEGGDQRRDQAQHQHRAGPLHQRVRRHGRGLGGAQRARRAAVHLHPRPPR